MANAKILSGLPPYGPMASAYPPEWVGREGTVVEFRSKAGAWIGNFKPGVDGLEFAGQHPDGRHAVVIASGDLWIVDPDDRSAELLLSAIEAALDVQDPDGWIFSRQGLALARLGPTGLIWHTRRLSWDGFDQLTIVGNEIKGLAWSPLEDQWLPFRVDIRTGISQGGSFGEKDREQWEKLSR